MSEKPRATRTKAKATIVPPSTRTTRARAAATNSTPTELPVAPPKKITRKPLASRNAVESEIEDKHAKVDKVLKSKAKDSVPRDEQREHIMAFLRIRPFLGEGQPSSHPYLLSLSNTSVQMTDTTHDEYNSRYRPSALPSSAVYTFSQVFEDSTTQSAFFSGTILPLVNDVLNGQNALAFAYGATNSGKTYTIQGGSEPGSAGILPRSLDVIFNSIEGLHSEGKYRPVRLQGVEPADSSDAKAPPVKAERAVTEVLGEQVDLTDPDTDPTVIPLDRNYEYSIWVSYAEVYNEKVFDLLDSVHETGNQKSSIPRSASKPLVLTRKALALKPSPPSDGSDATVKGKYIDGLRQFRVHSADQAKGLVKLGQLHRRVFGTLANRESSRSHSMLIIKVVRGHKGERNNATALQVSRLTLVDLAGSERTKHTHTTGDRLKEAGNINKSLMVLGQCLEVLRTNQKKLAMSLAQVGEDGRMDTRDVKKNLSVVPFRHSKLTETLMDYFVGDGRTVMIVNVNPYDTGYDENSHVMKFAALAREVYLTPAPAPLQKIPETKNVTKTMRGALSNLASNLPEMVQRPFTRKVTLTMGVTGKKDTVLEVMEEDAGDQSIDAQEEEDYPINPLVDELFDEVEYLRMQLYESHMRCAMIEKETRDELIEEFEERIQTMEKRHNKRLQEEMAHGERKTDDKIDLLYRSGLFASPVKKGQRHSALSEDLSEDESEEEVGEEVDSDEEEEIEEEYSEYESGDSDVSVSPPPRRKSTSPSKCASNAPMPIREVVEFILDDPMVPSDTEEAEMTEAETESCADSETDGHKDEDSEGGSLKNGQKDWLPEEARTPKTPRKSLVIPSRLPTLEKGVASMSLDEADQQSLSRSRENAIVVPKKKKRILAKQKIMTEDEIERMTQAMESRRISGPKITRLI